MSRTFSDAERRDALRLARSDGVGPVTFQDLMLRCDGPSEALDALPDLVRRSGRGGAPHIASRQEAEAELAAGDTLGARLLVIGETDYPERLAAIPGAPPVIWVLGRPERLSDPSIAIVGARVASAAGRRFAQDLARDLGEAGCTIVSGLARGIDSAAHAGSLETGTIAVLAGGPDDVYPPENRGLYEQIARTGCIVTERPPGLKAKAQDFVRRNRIISGLSLAVVVVEAELRSGSLTTARLAGEQGREVLAVPGSPLDPRAKGCNDLIRSGAGLCECAEDVLRAIGAGPRLLVPKAATWRTLPEPEADDTDALRERLAGLLSPTPVSRDELVRACERPAPDVFAALMELSLSGRAELLDGGLVAAASR